MGEIIDFNKILNQHQASEEFRHKVLLENLELKVMNLSDFSKNVLVNHVLNTIEKFKKMMKMLDQNTDKAAIVNELNEVLKLNGDVGEAIQFIIARKRKHETVTPDNTIILETTMDLMILDNIYEDLDYLVMNELTFE